MYCATHCKKSGRRVSVCAARLAAMLTAWCLVFLTASCRSDTADDKNMTENLVKSYMESFCGYDIGKMNKSSLLKLETYSDGDEVNTSCKLLASKVKWTIESINVSGNSAIAQVSLSLPADFESICQQALDDAMLQIEQDSDRLPAEIINLAIKKYAGNADQTSMTAEISMSKVNNQWYIAKSQDVTEIISDIRTPVAAVYSVIGQ